jgi:hypothetical protein
MTAPPGRVGFPVCVSGNGGISGFERLENAGWIFTVMPWLTRVASTNPAGGRRSGAAASRV